MYPWFWYWAPQVHFPWSGCVAQRIEPDNRMFFDAIPVEAGNGKVEKEIFDVASYGHQLGLITEVLLSQASQDAIVPDQAEQSLADLKKVYAKIKAVKRRNKDELARSAIAVLKRLEKSDRAELERVLAQFPERTPLLTHQSASRS
ncbi:MAG TPA: hypothetical protein VN663_00810 [Ramlibacter sp.]|nr:hypothetical protein [Ramlibacter sp.]